VRIPILGSLLLPFAAGCGAGATGLAAPAHAGDPEAPPGVEALPSTVTSDMSERMRFGWLLAEESLGLEPPDLPARRETRVLQRWTSTELRRWLARRSHTVEAARRELDRAAEQTHRQRIVAGALVGMLYEDVAGVLLSVPVPDDLHSEPDIAAMYRDVLRHQASPWVEHARSAYRACAQHAVEPRDMHPWSVFCARRADRLPPPRDTLTRRGTSVTVSVAY